MGKKVKKTFLNIGASLIGAGTGGIAGLAMSQLLKKKKQAGAAAGAIEGVTPKADPANDALRAAQGLPPVGVPQSNVKTPAQILEEQRKRRTLLGGATGAL